MVLTSPFTVHLSPLSAEKVVRLESLNGLDTNYPVSDLLRVEFIGDSIRFIEQDGSLAAEVYKYDYVKLLIADDEDPTGIENTNANANAKAVKIIRDGQVYILWGDKAYRIDGTEVR
jgi:hypothetical protein